MKGSVGPLLGMSSGRLLALVCAAAIVAACAAEKAEVPQDAPPGPTIELQINAGGLTSNVTSIAVQ